ncbi:MAG: exonuclease domain-containing protein [Rhizobiaceae bacterium]
MTYVFYDTETTGTETAFDQILQFAAIKTDDDFNELDSFNIRCRIHPYAVPSPGALFVTNVTPAMLVDQSYPSHYEAIRKIRAKLMSWSPAVFVGYNSIDFDEDLLRQALFQTLHSAYLTNTNGNARGDVMRFANAVASYYPDAIAVPEDEKGRKTFKLERLAPANGFQHDNAHEAMSDVRATIFMARLLRERAPDVWDAMSRATRKADAVDMLYAAPILSITERMFGRTYSWLATACGTNPNNSGQVAIFDLAYNPDEYIGLSADELIDVLNAKTKVIRTVRANAQPIVMPANRAPDIAKALAVPKEERERRAALVADNAVFQARVAEALSRRHEDKEPPAHIEQRIYDGFPSDADNILMEKFHGTPWADRHDFCGKFKDERVSEFSRRVIYCERPETLPKNDKKRLKEWALSRVTTTNDVPWMTAPKALAQLEEVSETANEEGAKRITEIKAYIDGLVERIEKY